MPDICSPFVIFVFHTPDLCTLCYLLLTPALYMNPFTDTTVCLMLMAAGGFTHSKATECGYVCVHCTSQLSNEGNPTALQLLYHLLQSVHLAQIPNPPCFSVLLSHLQAHDLHSRCHRVKGREPGEHPFTDLP